MNKEFGRGIHTQKSVRGGIIGRDEKKEKKRKKKKGRRKKEEKEGE